MNQPDQPVSINIFEQIDAICREFRRECKEGKKPHLELYLENVGQDARSMLFRNLLTADIDYRRRTGENATSTDYIKRFPEYARLIRQAFYESTMMSMDPSVSTPRFSMQDQLGDRTVTLAIPAANRLGDYLLITELGRGGFGVVYEAQHVQRQNRVALKTLPIGQEQHSLDDAERLHNFRREFRSLADINHPNLVGMQTLEVDGNQWFFTMDLVDGDDFLDYVRPNAELDEQRLRDVLPQLANGIMALHSQRIIHRDLKPSNVLVDQEGKVIILDFGLVMELAQRTDQTISLQSSKFAGTPVYSAPEQIMGKSESASDWYAVGVMLYEALTGERPFTGTALQVFEQKKNQPAPALSGRDDLPDDLAELCDGLLRREPGDRPGPLDIAKAFSIQTESTGAESIDLDFRPTIDESGQLLIGRDKQLAELNGLKDRLLEERKPIAVFITGKSGEGKTSLAEKFLGSLRLGTEVLVLSGRCYDRGSVPFKAIDSFIDSLVAYLRGRGDSHVEKLLPEDIRMLVHLFPVMGRVNAIGELAKTPIGQLDSKQIRARAFNALGKLLRNIGTDVPIVMFIDDLQWGDTDSAEVLLQILTGQNAAAMLFVGSYRRDEAEESAFLRQWEKQHPASDSELLKPNVVVGPLSEQQCLALMIVRFGDSSMIRRRAVELYTSTGGNPYFLDQLIDCFDPDTGNFTPVPLSEMIQNKLAKLPADAAPILNVIAVSGSATSLPEACQAAGLSESAYATITHMRTERLVRLIGSEEQQFVDTYHDKIRETVLDKLDEQDRRRLHSKIGETIEIREGIPVETILAGDGNADEGSLVARVFDLAYHFHAAGDRDKAVAYCLLAAEQAKDQFALDVALENYSNAEAYLTESSAHTSYRIKSGQGEVLLQSGRYDEANQALQEALLHADEQHQRIKIKAALAAMMFFSQSVADSVQAFENLLRDLNVRVPKSRLGLLMAIARESCISLVLKVLPGKLYQRRSAADRQSILVIRLLNQMQFPYINLSTLPTYWSTLASINRARRYPGIPEMADCLANLGHCRTCISGRHKAGQQDFEKAIQIADRFDDELRKANAVFWQSIGLSVAGMHAKAARRASTATDLYVKIGDAYRLTFVNTLAAMTQSNLGNIIESVRLSKEAFEYAVRLGQARQAQFALCFWARATDGDLPFDELRSCFTPNRDSNLAQVFFLLAQSIWHRRHGRTERSLEVADQAFSEVKRHWLVYQYAIYGIVNLAHSIREHADLIESEDPSKSKRLRRRGLRMARWAVRFGRVIPDMLPYSLRELGLAHAAFGRNKRALKYVKRSCEVAHQQDARREYAKSLLVCGQLGETLGIAGAEQQIEEAQAKLAEFKQQIEQINAEMFGKSNHTTPESK